MTDQERKDNVRKLTAKIGENYKALKTSTMELADFFKEIEDAKGYTACQTALTELHKTIYSQYRPVCKRVAKVLI